MDLLIKLQDFSGMPISHQTLVAILRDYKRPNEKIHELIKSGVLLAIKRGFYVLGEKLKTEKTSPLLLANHLLGPSYVSLESALSYHDLIPERVFQTTSVTIKSSRKFNTPLGHFEYTKLPMPYYSHGIQQIKLSKTQSALMATPEKALCDKIITTKGVLFKNTTNTLQYLTEDLRIEETNIKNLNAGDINIWSRVSPKQSSLQQLVKTIESL